LISTPTRTMQKSMMAARVPWRVSRLPLGYRRRYSRCNLEVFDGPHQKGSNCSVGGNLALTASTIASWLLVAARPNPPTHNRSMKAAVNLRVIYNQA
jgi:hypothetical protein